MGKRRATSTWRLKKALASLIVIGGLSFVTVSGTYAVLNSTESNFGSKVATGTLTFTNKANALTACASYGAGSTVNANPSCNALVDTSTLQYPSVAALPTVKIANDGSVDAADLKMYMATCTWGTTPGAPVVTGATNPCLASGLQFYLQETDSGGTPTTCWFPVHAAGACTWFASSLFVYQANHHTAAGAIDLGVGPAAGQARYFVIGLKLDAAAANTLQGQSATFPLTWHIST